ncbi:hypothetical protein P171DRAFT_501535, partial [Karstenula rhodostoma CBS 690.94]
SSYSSQSQPIYHNRHTQDTQIHLSKHQYINPYFPAMPHKSQRRTPRPPKPAPRRIAPRPTGVPHAPPTAPTALPTPEGPTKPYHPLPPALAQQMKTLIALSRRLESILHGLSYGLFTTPAEHRDAQTRLKHLRTVYHSLHPHVDRELASLGYLPAPCSSNIPHAPAPRKTPPPMLNTMAYAHASPKQKYGPTSPQYTVDKALKRKADSRDRAAALPPAKKKQRVDVDGAESDFVETDCESVDEGGREVEAEWPPAPLTNLAKEVPLEEAEWERIMGWSWGWAVRRGRDAVVGEEEEEWMSSPLGTVVVW